MQKKGSIMLGPLPLDKDSFFNPSMGDPWKRTEREAQCIKGVQKVAAPPGTVFLPINL